MKFNSLNIGSLFGRCNNIFHRLTRFLKRALAVKKLERNETYRSNKHQRPRPHNRPRILNKIFIFRSAGRLFPLFLSKCRHLTNGNQRWLATGKSLHVSILLGRISVHCRTRKTNKRLLIFSLSFSCRLSFKKKKKRTEINYIKMLNLIFVHPIYIGREELLQKIIARPCTIVTFIFKDIKLYKN